MTTVIELINQVERSHPGRIAVEDLQGRRLTVSEVRRRSNRVAHALIAAGLRRGDGVMYLGRNHLEYVEIEQGIAKAGLARIPLYHQLSERDLARAVELTGARVVIADAEAVERGRLEPLAEAFSHRIVLGRAEGWTSYEDWVADASDVDVAVAVDPEDTYHVRMTSGSSGAPKGIVVSHRAARHAMLGNLFVLNREGFEARPRTFQQAPVTLASGWTVLPTLLSGGTNIMAGRFDPDRAAQSMADAGATWSFVVPTMLRMMAAHDALEPLRTSRMSALCYGGEPAPLEVLPELLEVTDALVGVYGQTESPSWTMVLGRDDHRDPANWGAVGRAIPGVEVGVCDSEGTISFDEGDGGELVIRGGNRCSAILGDEASYAKRLLPGDWWRTGDLARLGEDGMVRLQGRESEMIIRGGSNVHPAEIEANLGRHAQVREVVVVGVADAIWGEVPVALVNVAHVDDALQQDVEAWAQAQLAGPKRPARILLTDEPLPRADADSKISRSLAKARVESLLADPSLCADGAS